MIFLISNMDFKKPVSNEGVFLNWHSWMFDIKGFGVQILCGVGSVADAWTASANGGLTDKENVIKSIRDAGIGSQK